jgi:hypothetical protein
LYVFAEVQTLWTQVAQKEPPPQSLIEESSASHKPTAPPSYASSAQAAKQHSNNEYERSTVAAPQQQPFDMSASEPLMYENHAMQTDNTMARHDNMVGGQKATQ